MALVVSTLVTCAEISTRSLTSPGFKAMLTRVVSVTRTSILSARDCENPVLLTST